MTPQTQIEAAEARGYDRAFALYKNGEPSNADNRARLLYPDNTELQNACAKGMRRGWAEASK
jgi:hypothetical protein